MRFQNYIEDNYLDDYSNFTYEMYCECLDLSMANRLNELYFVNEGIFDKIKELKLASGIIKFFKEAKDIFAGIAGEFKLGLSDVVKAFKNRDVFGLIKAFGFNIKLMIKSINEFTGMMRKGILKIFEELVKTGAFKKIRSGAMKVDEVLDKYPLLKKVAGIAVAGLLLYIWLNMTFIGDLDYDFNFGDLVSALKGSFSLADMFVSPQGLMLIALLGSGMLGISAPWLGKTAYNLVLAISYTAFSKIKDIKIVANIRSKLKLGKI